MSTIAPPADVQEDRAVIRHHDRLAHRRGDEKGLALLDVVIGMSLFALLAIIALQAFGQYRERAFEASAVSDARAFGLAYELSYSDHGRYLGNPYRLMREEGINLSPGVGLEYETTHFGLSADRPGEVSEGGAYAVWFCVEHRSGDGSVGDAWALYDSAVGVVQSGRGEGCPTDYRPSWPEETSLFFEP